jgi:hypothetical protein
MEAATAERWKVRAWRWGLACIALAGLALRFAGLNEGVHLHPDEVVIADWMNRMHETHRMGRTYAGGFFVLASAARTAAERTLGAVRHRWEYFTRQSDDYTVRTDTVGFGRACNAWMGVAAALLAALAIRRMTGSRAAGLAGAALMAFEAYSIEHAHYLETDAAMLLALAAFLWAAARFSAGRSAWAWAAAAALAGFAAGTKYPMAMLAAVLVLGLRVPAQAAGLGRAGKAAWVAALVLAGAWLAWRGFLLAVPDASDWGAFSAALERAGGRVYGETAGIVGEAADEPFVRQRMNAAALWRFAGAIGAGWAVLAAWGLALAAGCGRFRRHWPVLLAYPGICAAYSVFQAPWLRSQEFLALVPALAMWAALPVAWAWGKGGKGWRLVAAVMVLAALLPVARTGDSMASLFGWEDTRRLANRDLASWYPPDMPLAIEQYGNFTDVGVSREIVHLTKYAALGRGGEALEEFPPYFLLNEDFKGRGLVHPVTRRWFPDVAARDGNLRQNGILVGAWGVLDSPAPQPTFRSPRMALWKVPEAMAQDRKPPEELGVPLPRPARVLDPVASRTGRDTFFKGEPAVGARKALLVDKRWRQVALGGPGNVAREGAWAVLATRERGATVELRGFGRTREVAVAPHSAVAVPLRRAWWDFRRPRFERLSFRAEETEPTLTWLPCFLEIAFSPLEAACILLDAGHPAQAAAFLRDGGAPEADSPFWRALAGDRAAAGEARELLARWRAAADGPASRAGDFAAGGLPLDVWQDFARIRLVPMGSGKEIRRPRPDGGGDGEMLGDILPVEGVPQTLSFRIRAEEPGAGAAGAPVWSVEPRFALEPDADGVSRTTREFAGLLQLRLLESREGPAVRLEAAEYTWDWRDMLRKRVMQLETALEEMERAENFRFVCGDLLGVRGIRREGKELRVSLVPLRDGLPPLAFRWQENRKGRWRDRGDSFPLPARTARGEAFEVAVPVPEKASAGKWGLRLESAVEFHPGILPFSAPEGESLPCLPLP